MSATFKQAIKKKTSQDEIKRLMAQHKEKSKPQTKITNPLAKYTDAGQLMCILCKSIVRSEKAWDVHVNAKQHRENVSEAKKLKELTNNFTTAAKVSTFKRPASPCNSVPEKKPKSILKNAPSMNSVPVIVPQKPKDPSVPDIISHHDEEIKRAPLKPLREIAASSSKKDKGKSKLKDEKLKEGPDAPIPEGFFDDPKLDAKARNIEYKDPIEEEWDKFQKEMREETSASAEIIAGEQEEATAERQIDEIDEQMRNWSRVLDLELKKEETKKKAQEKSDMASDSDGDASENEADIDEFLDWRAKKSFR